MGVNIFDSSIQKTNLLLKEIEHELGWEGKELWAYKLLRAVLHALRDRLTVEEAADLGAQLPMVVRGFYYEGWRPANLPIKFKKEEFLEEIQKNLTFPSERAIEELVRPCFKVLEKHMAGEMKSLQSILPKNFHDLF
ncbi:MAG TPA: DUF2267 domain-containing protein [Candidatus Moranbacteria bacterium]|nr:DUF2267 domain-containing protein [Candidatus Moranbacteria bacterium]